MKQKHFRSAGTESSARHPGKACRHREKVIKAIVPLFEQGPTADKKPIVLYPVGRSVVFLLFRGSESEGIGG
jgi:hypothetical protein